MLVVNCDWRYSPPPSQTHHFSFFNSYSQQAVECCAPQFISQEDDLYTEADEKDVEKSCFHSDCDKSFFTDIASSLNVIGNPLIGCASGLGVCGFYYFIFIILIFFPNSQFLF